MCFVQVYSILRHCAEILGYETDKQLEELYEKSAWYFDEKYKSPGSSYEVFKLAVGQVSKLNKNFENNYIYCKCIS